MDSRDLELIFQQIDAQSEAGLREWLRDMVRQKWSEGLVMPEVPGWNVRQAAFEFAMRLVKDQPETVENVTVVLREAERIASWLSGSASDEGA